jgi:nucleoside phosphorylase
LLHAGIIIPTTFEFASLLELYPELANKSPAQSSPWQIYQAQLPGLKLTVIISFIGPANAAAACEHLISLGADFILHGGAAGAINDKLLPGDIVFGAHCKIICSPEVLEVRKTLLLSTRSIRYMRHGEAVYLEALPGDSALLSKAEKAFAKIQTQSAMNQWNAPGWPDQLPPRQAEAMSGTIGSLDGWTKGLSNLQFVRQTFACDAEDMESAYIAQVAAMNAVPQLAVRAISNNEYLGTLAKDEIIPAVQGAAARVSIIFKAMLDEFI